MAKKGLEIAICDDEPYITAIIDKFVQEYYGVNCLSHSFNSGEMLLNLAEKYDIVFLDIELGESNGIELAKTIRKSNKKAFIIFVTNYTDYCRQAFNVHAFQYLTKPISKEKLFHVLDEVETYRKNDIQNECIRLKSSDGIVQVEINEIIYFEYYLRKVKMVLENDKYLLTYSLQELKELFCQYDFAMCHRAYIVNLRKIQIIDKFDIHMSNGDLIPLAQKQAAEFKREFEIYLYTYKRR